jgi:hypothetical protein
LTTFYSKKQHQESALHDGYLGAAEHKKMKKGERERACFLLVQNLHGVKPLVLLVLYKHHTPEGARSQGLLAIEVLERRIALKSRVMKKKKP